MSSYLLNNRGENENKFMIYLSDHACLFGKWLFKTPNPIIITQENLAEDMVGSITHSFNFV